MSVWVLLGGEVVFLVCGEIVGSVCWRYTRTFGTLSAWGLCAHDRNCRSSVVGYISAPLGLSLCVCQSGGRGRYRLGEIEVFGISFVLLLLQN